MTTPLRYSLTCLVALLVTGCGGSSSSSSSAVERTIKSAPAQAEFFDTDGALVSRMQFQYPDELTINVQLQTAGTDMLWDTEDDTSRSFLECLYMSAPTPLLRYPDLYFLGISRTPTGSAALAQLGIKNGLVKCPVRSGRRLLQESGYADNPTTSNPSDGYNYLINAELEHFGATATESLNYETDLGGTVAVELDLPFIGDHTQITTVNYDAEQRPLSIDLSADSPWTAVLDEYCVDGDTLATLLLLRSCSSARETRSYRYLDDSVEQDVQRYNGSYPADLYTSTATRLASSVIVHPGTVDATPTSGTFYTSYSFNDSEQVTAKVSHSAGADGIWDTEDDLHDALDTYHYDDNGRLSEIRYSTVKMQAYDYYPSGKLKQVDAFDSLSDIPSQRTLIAYRHGAPAQITVQRRFEDPEEGYVLKTRIVMEFAPSEDTWAALFSPIALFPRFPEMPPSIDDLMQFQPIR